MRSFELSKHDDFEGWRQAAKDAFAQGLKLNEVRFQVAGETEDLFASAPLATQENATQTHPKETPKLTVPATFISLAKQVVCHSDDQRFSLLYELLLALQDDKTLMQQSAHKLVHRANVLAKEIRRDVHKMKAFVRFRKADEVDGVENYVAWFEPTHHIVEYGAGFFMRRFAKMHWSILTPKGCAHWDTHTLRFSGPVPKSNAPSEDALEDFWRSYYASIFNPARLKIDAMTSEMPKKYWKNLPEAQLIPGMIEQAKFREAAMRSAEPTNPNAGMMRHIAENRVEALTPPKAIDTLDDLRDGLKRCRSCPLWKPATQVVPGHGPEQADIMFVGEQPGDREDLSGEPFVGPAGQVLRDVMQGIGHNMEDAYVTNAVKHFKFEPRGKRRIHKNPTVSEIDHCSWWLKREIELVQPRVIVALGGSAVRALTGKTATVKSLRAKAIALEKGTTMIVTNHPSYILRLPNPAAQQEAKLTLANDLQRAFSLL